MQMNMTDTQLYLALGVPMLFNATIVAVFTAYVHSVSTSLNSKIETLDRSVAARMGDLDRSLTARMGDLDRSLTARMGDLERSFSARLTDQRDTLRAEAAKNHSEILAKLTDMEHRLDKRIDGIEQHRIR